MHLQFFMLNHLQNTNLYIQLHKTNKPYLLDVFITYTTILGLSPQLIITQFHTKLQSFIGPNSKYFIIQ